MRDRLPTRPFLYPIVDVTIVGEPFVLEALRALVAAGCALIQLRAKNVGDARFVELARAAVAAAHEGGARLVVNDRPDVARIVGADGVHVGQEDVPPADARAVLGPAALIGFSTHDLDQVRATAGLPIDYVALGPIFPTTSKEDADSVVGPDLLTRARALTSLPLVAIGGISQGNAAKVVAAGADGLAVIGALGRPADMARAVHEFEEALRVRS